MERWVTRLFKTIKPKETRREQVILVTNDLVFFKGAECIVLGGFDRPPCSDLDYDVIVAPCYADDDIGFGPGRAVVVKANDCDLIPRNMNVNVEQ